MPMAIERLYDLTDTTGDSAELYTAIEFPPSPVDRPYVYVNMVSTVDGKILIGPRGSTAKGVGGPTDQLLMRRLEESADAIIIGAGTLRPGHVIYPPEKWRAVVTRSGELPLENRFFTDAPGKAVVFAPGNLAPDRREALEKVARVRLAGTDSVDLAAALGVLRSEFGIRKLLLEGGADLNADFFLLGRVDELFITIAPKIKGGVNLPTPVEGPGFPDRRFASLQLRSIYRDADEVYFRYRVGATESA